MDANQNRLHDILDSEAVSRINFRAGSVWVASAGYARVREALRNNQMTVSWDPMIPRTQCRYFPVRNRLTYGISVSFNNTFDQALFVHEATHAWQDFLGRPMNVLDAEVAAYIAQGFYLVAKGMTYEEVEEASSARLGGDDEEIEVVEANPIVMDAYSAAKDVFEQSGGYRVPDEAARFVRESILADRSNYRNADTRSAGFNGIGR